MYSDIGQKSNTMIFSDRPADVNALLAQATAVVRSMGNTNINAAEVEASNAIRSEDLSYKYEPVEYVPEHGAK
jgi:hypothetical protein